MPRGEASQGQGQGLPSLPFENQAMIVGSRAQGLTDDWLKGLGLNTRTGRVHFLQCQFHVGALAVCPCANLHERVAHSVHVCTLTRWRSSRALGNTFPFFIYQKKRRDPCGSLTPPVPEEVEAPTSHSHWGCWEWLFFSATSASPVRGVEEWNCAVSITPKSTTF